MSSPIEQRAGDRAAEPAAVPCSQPEPKTRQYQWLLLTVAVAFGYLYVALFSLRGIPYFGGFDEASDQSAFWTFACRLLSGQVFLRDFHQFTAPGTDLIFAAVFHWFGTGMGSINWTILGLGIALVLASYLVARSILPPRMAALAALLCLVILYGDRLDATHHWFGSLANLLAVLVLIPRRSWPRIAAAGAFLALAAFCTQTRGAAGLLACSAGLAWELRNRPISWRLLGSRLTLLFGVTLAVWLLLSWRFMAQAGLARYWYEQVVYLPKDAHFPMGFLKPQFSLRTWSPQLLPTVALLNHLTTYFLLLFVCPRVIVLCARRRSDPDPRSVAPFLLASLGVFQALEVITVLNWNRMAAVAIPSVILAVWLIDRMGPARRAVVAGCWCVVAASILVKSAATEVHPYTPAELPAGIALVEQRDADEVLWLAQHTRRGDWFFEVATTRLYAPLALKNPTPVHLLTARGSTPSSWVAEVVQGLEQSRTRYILWSPHCGIGYVEGGRLRPSDLLDPLRTYIRYNYTRAAVFANRDEIWERKN